MVELLYVDEQEGQAGQVLRSAFTSGYFTQDQVASIEPSRTLDETIDNILGYHCKVLITDHKLSDHKAEVEFSGTDLVKEFQSRFNMFPCFVTTSFADEAAIESNDVNLIFPKADFLDQNDGEPSELPFFRRVRLKIEEYEVLVETTQNRFDELRKLGETEDLSAAQAEELLTLDNQLEALHGQKFAVEGHLKLEALKPFGQLIEKTEALIEKIEAELSNIDKTSE